MLRDKKKVCMCVSMFLNCVKKGENTKKSFHTNVVVYVWDERTKFSVFVSIREVL